MSQGENDNPILFVAKDAETRYGLRQLLEDNGREVYCRDTRVRALQLLTVYLIDLIVVDSEMADASGMEFLRQLRGDASFNSIPVVYLGPEQPDGATCVAALEAGADDFVPVPYPAPVLMARIKRLLKRKVKTATKAALAVQVGGQELPGILQYLEAEQKTGRLEVKSGERSAAVFLNSGMLASAEAPFAEGTEAIVDILCWENVNVAFHERELKPEELKLNLKLTSVVMNGVVEVDEFREIQAALPAGDVLLLATGKELPAKASAAQKSIYEMAINGYLPEDLLKGQEASERRCTLLLNELLTDGYLKLGPAPFADYLTRLHDQYKSSFFENRLTEVRKILTAIEFPLKEPEGYVPGAASDWLSPAPRLLVTGDNLDHVDFFVRSLANIYISYRSRKPPSQRHHKGVVTTRLDFDDKRILDVQQLPPVLEKAALHSLDEYMTDICGVVFLVSAQDRKTSTENLRLLRQLRQRFFGVYYAVVPRVLNAAENRYMFKTNCPHCGYKLAVSVDDAGVLGECPICNKDIEIPDCMDNLVRALRLPDDVPVVMIEPDSASHCRDLVVMMIDAVLRASKSPKEASVIRKLKTDVKERVAADKRAAEEAQANQYEDYKIDQTGTRTVTVTKKQDAPPPPPPKANLDDILKGKDEDFNIEEFIKKNKT